MSYLDNMKLTIELSEKHARILRSWASVSRSFDAIEKYVEDTSSLESSEDVMMILDDIQALRPVFDSIHSQVRSQLVAAGVKPLWNQNQG